MTSSTEAAVGFRQTRAAVLLANFLAYGLALMAALYVGSLLTDQRPLMQTLWADLVGTGVIFIFAMLIRNSSMYDPYWSVAPLVIVIYWAMLGHDAGANDMRQWAIIAAVYLWGVRLTYNCFRRWTSLDHQDFRYIDLKKQTGKMYPIVDLLGIEVFPTLMVFAALMPTFLALTESQTGFNVLDVVALVLCVAAVFIEWLADQQLWKFISSNPEKGKVCDVGLWRWSRHPNYFGEMLFWWGIYVFALAADTSWWWTIFGPLAMTALFVFISVPMMQKRHEERRPGYGAQVAHISKLIPLPPKNR